MRLLLVIFLYFVQAKYNVESKESNGYVTNKSTGLTYRIFYNSQPWLIAKDICEDEGGKLAVPETQEDFIYIQQIVRAMHYPDVNNTKYKLLVWVGINNLDDYKIWKTVDGKNIENNEFHTWAEANGKGHSNAVEEPHCAGLDAINPGLREFWCHRRQPYLCQFDIESQR